MSVIDDYLKKLEPAQKASLGRVRKLAMQVVPEATDTIGYGMPVLKYKGKYLLGFAPFKDHLSIFPGSEAVEIFKDQLKDFKTSKGTVQFTLDQPIPDELLKEIISSCRQRIG